MSSGQGFSVATDKNTDVVIPTQNSSDIVVGDRILTETPIDQKRVQEISAQIDLADTGLTLAYGAKTMNSIAQFADTLLEKVKAKDAGVVGSQLSELLMRIREYDPINFDEKQSGFLARLPVVGSFFKKIERTRVDQQTLTSQVDVISSHLDKSMVGLLRDIEVLEQLYVRNFEFYNEITLYVEAGKQKVQAAREQELPVLQKQAEVSEDLMDAQKAKDFTEQIQRFERRLHDLELSKIIAVQTAPQIRLIQSNNQTLAEKIQSSILSTLPIWKSQMVLAMSIDSQAKAAQLQKDIADTTNDLLKKNAEMLQQSSIDTAKAVERSVVDVETLRDVQNRLVGTIEETVKIAAEARVRRAEVEKELVTMEEDLRLRIVKAASAG